MPEPTLFENLWKFAKQRLRTLELFPEYLQSIIAHWNEIFFLSIPTLPFVAWWYIGELPVWIRVGVFLWVLVFAGYYAWREEYLNCHCRRTAQRPMHPDGAIAIEDRLSVWSAAARVD